VFLTIRRITTSIITPSTWTAPSPHGFALALGCLEPASAGDILCDRRKYF
jgi:hypothetical protein